MKKRISSRLGETITESIVSILVFTFMVLAVTTMIQSAIRITSTYARSAQTAQESGVNPLVLGVSGSSETIAFTSGAAGINAWHTVTLSTDDGLIAFDPEASGP